MSIKVNGEYGVRWTEFDRSDRLVTKEKMFGSIKSRDKFIEELMRKSNFNEIVATTR